MTPAPSGAMAENNPGPWRLVPGQACGDEPRPGSGSGGPTWFEAAPDPRGNRWGLLPVLDDNYIIVFHDGQRAVAVDPAVAPPLIAWLERRDLELVAILHTHHHSDHIGGGAALLQRWPQAAVIASAADRGRIPLQTQGVREGDRLSLLGRDLEVLEVPGHTRHHIAFHLRGAASAGGMPPSAGDLLCGDTLFAAGCGRLFEGTPEQMLASLRRLASLPDHTRVWCAHEYTATNLAWALSQRPDDAVIAGRLAHVRAARAAGQPSLPSRIDLEKATNLFLQAADPGAFADLRQSRNVWRG